MPVTIPNYAAHDYVQVFTIDEEDDELIFKGFARRSRPYQWNEFYVGLPVRFLRCQWIKLTLLP